MRATARHLPPDAVGASALHRATMAGESGAIGSYRHNPFSAESRAEAARIAADSASNRDAVADVLLAQNIAWNGGESVSALVEKLRDPSSVAVVTGQQLGLFAGPLYTIYKAISAVRWAERIESETGRPAVPVFWLADEDHDFDEVRRATFTDGADVSYAAYDDGLSPEANRGPVGRMILDESAVARALRELGDALPDGPHRRDTLAMAREAYLPGRSMVDAFALLLRQLVPSMVFISADDARLKRLAEPLFAQEITDWSGTLAALEDRSAELERAGFHAQVAPTPVNLFWMADDGRRLPIDRAEDGTDAFAFRGEPGVISAKDLLARLDETPERFSPNVVLRPLQQDTLLPTVAYVAGPGEAAYFAQLGPVYERFGVPMPAILPRLSLTLIEPAVAKVLERYDLDVPDLKGDLAALWRRLALAESDTDLDSAFQGASSAAAALVHNLESPVTGVDSSLQSALGAADAAFRKALDRLQTKTVRVQKRRHQDIGDRLVRAQTGIWPGGALQERVLNPLQVVAKHGTAFLPELLATLDLDARGHHVVRV